MNNSPQEQSNSSHTLKSVQEKESHESQMENIVRDLLMRHHTENTMCEIRFLYKETISEQAENSYVKRWTVKLKMKSGKTRELGYISKSKAEPNLMQKEVKVYKEVLSAMENVMHVHDDRKDTLWCNMIAYREFDIILLEDMKGLNYTTLKRSNCLDYEHTMLTVCALGRFHALSKVVMLQYDNIQWKRNYRPYIFFQDDRLVELFIMKGLMKIEEVMRTSWGPHWIAIANRLQAQMGMVKEKINNLFIVDSQEFNVLNHGDLWIGNIMFKNHDFLEIPVSLRFIDFQVAHYNSLAWDLTYLLYSSVKPKLRRKYIEDFIKSYYTSFTNTLDFFSYSGVRPTLDTIFSEMVRLKFLAAVMLCTAYAITLSEGPELFSKSVDVIGDDTIGYDPAIFESNVLQNDIKHDLLEFVQDGII